MTYIQYLMKFYDNNRQDILGFTFYAFIILLFLVCIYLKRKGQSLYFFWEKIYSTIIIIVIGTVLFHMGLSPDIKYDYFNLLIFIAFNMFLMLYLLGLFIKYLKIIPIVVHHIKYAQYAIYFELFLLALTNNRQFLETLVGITAICILESLKKIYDYAMQQKEIIEKDKLTEDDYPTALLYPSRKAELENFCLALKQVSEEPYAVMISGAWGVGKTSFVKALERRLSDDIFIWLEAGGEKSVSEIMVELSQKIIDILRAKKIYLEDADMIDRYFQAFSGIMAENGWKFLDKITSIYHADGPDTHTKAYLNRKLSALESKVYLIVDDLDRCSAEYKSKMFKVIRESTQLTNCKTIFLANREAFLDKKQDNQYIEKYISYQLELHPITYSEIINEYWEIIFNDTYFANINKSIWYGRDSQILHKEMLKLPFQFLKVLKNTLSDLKSKQNPAVCSGDIQKDIQHINTAIRIIETDITNSRKAKKFLKGVKSDITKLNSVWADNYINLYLNNDWITPIIRVQFLRHFFPDNYWELYACNSVEKYQGINAIWIKTILEMPHHDMSQNELREILNLVIYQLDVLDFEKNKTAMQKYLDELNSDSPNIKHIENYINYLTTINQYEEYFKVIALYDAHKSSLSRLQTRSFIQALLQKMARQYIKDLSAFLQLSETVIAVLQKSCLPASEISICQGEGQEIISRCLECSVKMLKNPIFVIFGVNIPKMPDEFYGVTNFKELYDWLCSIDKSIAPHDNTQGIDELTFIQQYYQKLASEMQNPKYAEIYPYIKSDLENCQLLFKICRIWKDVSMSLQYQTGQDSVFVKYFSLGSRPNLKRNALSIDNIQEALDSLKNHYEVHEADKSYTRDLIELFLQLLGYVISLLSTNRAWFKGQESQLDSHLHKTAGILCRPNTDLRNNDLIQRVHIMLFDFNRRVKENLEN